jgi:cell division protein FtsB
VWLRGIRFSGFSLLMMGLLVLGVVVLAPNITAFVEQRQQIAELNAQLTEDRDTVERLSTERERWDDSTFVMTQARERFFYVNPGEVSFLIINDLDAAVLADVDEPVSDELTTTDTDWTEALLASLLSAAYADEVQAPE